MQSSLLDFIQGVSNLDPINFILAFVFGLSASFYPCLFPVLPSYIAFVSSDTTETDIKNGILSSILVTLGIMTVFVGAGLLVNTILTSLLSYLGDNYQLFRFLQGLMLAILGLVLILGISFNINRLWEVSAFSNTFITRFKNPWLVAYLIGFFFSLLAAPCALIIFITIFTLIAGQGPIVTILMMILFSLGAGIPFIIIGVIVPVIKQSFEEKFITSKNVIEGANKLNRYLPYFTGSILILIGIALIAGFDLATSVPTI